MIEFNPEDCDVAALRQTLRQEREDRLRELSEFKKINEQLTWQNDTIGREMKILTDQMITDMDSLSARMAIMKTNHETTIKLARMMLKKIQPYTTANSHKDDLLSIIEILETEPTSQDIQKTIEWYRIDRGK